MLYANNIYMPATILNHFQLLLTVLCAPRVVILLYSTCSRHLCDESVPSSHWTVKHLHGWHGLMFCLSPVPRNAWHILSIQKKKTSWKKFLPPYTTLGQWLHVSTDLALWPHQNLSIWKCPDIVFWNIQFKTIYRAYKCTVHCAS